MSVTELWNCDWHEAERSEDYPVDDQARDDGWIMVQRREPYGYGISGERWVEYHVCAECQKDPDVQQALRDDGYVNEDLQPIRVVVA